LTTSPAPSGAALTIGVTKAPMASIEVSFS
jgi:hypothetical protein